VQNEPLEVTLLVTGTLEALAVPYFIGGSLASALYGMVRNTQDSDIVAAMKPEHLEPFLAALQEDFYLDEEMIADAIRRSASFNIIHRETMFKVDVFIPIQRRFLQSQFSNAREHTFTISEAHASACFAGPEDTVLAKLEWYRSGGEVSDRQWRDILGILKTRAGELDPDYLRRWGEELGVRDLLERALQEAGLMENP